MVIIELEDGLVSALDRNFYEKLRTEETKFTDPGWVEVFKKLKTVSEYFQKMPLVWLMPRHQEFLHKGKLP